MSCAEQKLGGKKILLTVSGGIAAYKSADLASKLIQQGGTVRTVMTENACKLIGPKTFEAITGNIVLADMWQVNNNLEIGHIELSQWADIVVIAPATANIIAKIANGICDDLASTMICASWQKPIVIAPAMNDKMWSNPAVSCNVETLKDRGFIFSGPNKGRLACQDTGKGRMAEPEEILKTVIDAVKKI